MSSFMSSDPNLRRSDTGDIASFAYSTVRTRWPRLLDSAIRDIELNLSPLRALSQDDVEAAKKILSQFAQLKSDLIGNASLTPIPEDGGVDIGTYNEELQALQPISWHSVPWLFSACYMYRLIHTFFSTSTPFWRVYDTFGSSKRQGLVGSRKGTLELIKHFHEMRTVIATGHIADVETQKAVFEEIIQISLWGNATDLGMLTTLTEEEFNNHQGKAAREKAKENVVADDTEEVWKLLSGLRSSGSRGEIHIVLDNAGFELLADLVLASYLIDSGCAQKVVLHGKKIPWFVSDVTHEDLRWLLDGLTKGSIYQGMNIVEEQELREAGEYWSQSIAAGQMEYQTHSFWTTAHPFGRMAELEPQLFEQIADAELVTYKGDLNYRKLTYDCYWPKTTSFATALGPLAEKHNGKGARTFVLRTCKADVCVGLRPGREAKLEDRWTRTGKYAVASYCDAKS
ncbi:hypothetical protein MBLNU459_g7655t1 [Dothideomycetes sp. NU459]